MRTKNAKRLWPVPATFVIVALAAFLAIGILAVNGNQPVAAQDDPNCEIVVSGKQVPTASGEEVSLAAVDPDPCVATGNMATIEFTGPSGRPGADDEPIVLYVLVEDDKGDLEYYADDTIYQSNTAIDIVGAEDTDPPDPDDGADISRPSGFYPSAAPEDVATGMAVAKTYTSMKVEVPLAEVEGGEYEAQSVTISVPGNFFIYTTSGFNNVATSGTFGDGGYGSDITCRDLTVDGAFVSYDADCATSEASTPKGVKRLTNPLPTAPAAVTVVLAGKPVLSVKVADPADTDPADGTDMIDAPRSRWQTSDRDEVDDNKIEIGSEEEEVALMPTIQDADGNVLEGEISFEVDYNADSSLKAGQNLSFSVPNRDFPTKAELTLDSWANDGPFKATVEARFEGASGNLELPDLTVFRNGPTVSISAVACSALPVDMEDMDTKDGCEKGSDPDTVFPPDTEFTIVAKAKDVTSNDTTDATTFTVEYPDDAQTEDGEDAFDGSFDDGMLTVDIDKDALFGSYDLVVTGKHGRGNDEVSFMETVTVIVSGPPMTYEIECDENTTLEAFASAECTVTAKDAQGNPPAFDMDEMDNTVSVVVESDLNVRVTGLENDKVTLDEQTGMDMFTVYKPADAMRGDTASIGIFVDAELMDTRP